jgi:hypothetical protein
VWPSQNISTLIGNSLFFKLIKPNLTSGKKKSSLKETYNRTTNGGHSKAQAPQGTPQRASQQIPKRTPDLSKAEESDENIYSEVDLTKTGMVCFHFHPSWTLGQFRGHNTAMYKIRFFLTFLFFQKKAEM